jgi:hypothetical protein
MKMTNAESMSATSPIRTSQSVSCLLVSICLFGLAVGVPLGLSSAGIRGKIPTLGSRVQIECAESRAVLRDCAHRIGELRAGPSAQHVYAAVNVEVVVMVVNGGTLVAI